MSPSSRRMRSSSRRAAAPRDDEEEGMTRRQPTVPSRRVRGRIGRGLRPPSGNHGYRFVFSQSVSSGEPSSSSDRFGPWMLPSRGPPLFAPFALFALFGESPKGAKGASTSKGAKKTKGAWTDHGLRREPDSPRSLGFSKGSKGSIQRKGSKESKGSITLQREHLVLSFPIPGLLGMEREQLLQGFARGASIISSG